MLLQPYSGFMGFDLPDQNAVICIPDGSWGWRGGIGLVVLDILKTHISDYKSIMGNLSGIVFLGDQIIREGSEYNEWYGYRSGGLFQAKVVITLHC